MQTQTISPLKPDHRDVPGNLPAESVRPEGRDHSFGESDVRLRNIFELSADLICIADIDGYFRVVNPSFTRVLGYSTDELLGKPFLEFVHPDDKEKTRRVIAEKLSRGETVFTFENRYICKGGGIAWLEWTSQPLVSAGYTIAIARDLTERKHAEELIAKQAREILDLATPVMQVWEGAVAAILIGTLDSQRAQQLTERLLERIVQTRSSVALVDITGVPTIDTQTGRHLIETITAIRLLGAEVVLTGVRPAIAQTLVHLGIDLSGVTTRSSLAAGLRVAFEVLNLQVLKRDGAA